MNKFIIFLDISGVLKPRSDIVYTNINKYFEGTSAQKWLQTLETHTKDIMSTYTKNMSSESMSVLQDIVSDILNKGYTPECVLISLTASAVPVPVWNKFFSYIPGESIVTRDALNVGKDRSGGYTLEESLRLTYKGIDIFEYLEENKDTVADYIIIDDDCQILPENKHRYYKTTSDTGLVENDISEIKKLVTTKG